MTTFAASFMTAIRSWASSAYRSGQGLPCFFSSFRSPSAKMFGGSKK